MASDRYRRALLGYDKEKDCHGDHCDGDDGDDHKDKVAKFLIIVKVGPRVTVVNFRARLVTSRLMQSCQCQ
jgi:hypothetical protein